MIGIAVGRSTKTNALSVYNPVTNQYYEPDTYKFDPSRLPCTEFPSRINYDGGLRAELYRHSHRNVPEPYPSGTQFKIPAADGNHDECTTAIVSPIPIRDGKGNALPGQYLLQLHDGTTMTKTLAEMDEIADSPANKTSTTLNPSLPVVESLPALLQHGSKVAYDYACELHKGFSMIGRDGGVQFSCRSQRSAKEESSGVALPNLITEWPSMSVKNIIYPT